MAESNPSIRRADLPREAQPNNTFPVEVEVEQASGRDPWGSDGYCISGLDIRGWRTPVELLVDGEVVDSQELCIVAGEKKQATLRASVPSGTHSLRVRVYRVGGFAYDLSPMTKEVNDEQSGTVTASTDASDPTEPTSSDKFMLFLEDVADALGTSVNMVAVGVVAAAAVFILL